MQHAYAGGTVIAIIAGIIGYFVVLRRSSFAAHALSHIGFAGAAAAVFFSINPVFGLLVFTGIGGVAMAGLGGRGNKMDVQIGVVLAFMLGLGLLFLALYSGYAQFVFSILFGEILAISPYNVEVTLVAGAVILIILGLIYRPLLFASLDEDVAEAKGIRLLPLGTVFMLLVAMTTSIAVQVVGVLLIFSLMVTPAAIAQQLAKQPRRAMAISVGISLMSTWLGLFIAFYSPYPVSFFITSIVFVLYLIVRFVYPRAKEIIPVRTLATSSTLSPSNPVREAILFKVEP
jgi:zinc/manganese transport system permease protein